MSPPWGINGISGSFRVARRQCKNAGVRPRTARGSPTASRLLPVPRTCARQGYNAGIDYKPVGYLESRIRLRLPPHAFPMQRNSSIRLPSASTLSWLLLPRTVRYRRPRHNLRARLKWTTSCNMYMGPARAVDGPQQVLVGNAQTASFLWVAVLAALGGSFAIVSAIFTWEVTQDLVSVRRYLVALEQRTYLHTQHCTPQGQATGLQPAPGSRTICHLLQRHSKQLGAVPRASVAEPPADK